MAGDEWQTYVVSSTHSNTGLSREVLLDLWLSKEGDLVLCISSLDRKMACLQLQWQEQNVVFLLLLILQLPV